MAPFKFPPPPPPPPPPSRAPHDAPAPGGSQRGGSSARSDRGYGRGGAPRGRGHHQFGAGSRGGYSRGGHRGGQQHQGGRGGSQNHGVLSQQQLQRQPTYTAPQIHGNAALPCAYPNPASPNLPMGNTPPLDPGAFAQAIAYMATPAGMQSMAAFAANMTSGNVVSAQGDQSAHQTEPSQPQPSPRKRKRNARVEPWKSQQASNCSQTHSHRAVTEMAPSQKPLRAKARAPPSIPGFGFSLPQIPQPASTSKAGGTQNHKQRRVNLGLTNMGYDDDSSAEEEDGDVDEEAALAAKWDGKEMTFEHNGETISLQTAAEFAEYIKDRKKNFPTQRRIAEKSQLAAEKRASELDFLRRVKGGPAHNNIDSGDKVVPKGHHRAKDTSKHVARTNPTLREQSGKGKNSTVSKHTTAKALPGETNQGAIDFGLGYETDTDSDEDSSVLSESSVVSSSESSEDDASDADANVEEAEDSDAPPEAQSSKIAATPLISSPPARLPKARAEDTGKNRTRMCAQWKATGKCKYKYCKHQHGEAELKRVGLYEKMVEQELEKADNLALQAIKYLGRNGYLG